MDSSKCCKDLGLILPTLGDAEVEAEKEEITRKAHQAFAEQKAFETELVEAACLLAAARQERGISLSQLAELTGMTRQALSRIERGENKNPTFSTLQTIAEADRKRCSLGQDVSTSRGTGALLRNQRFFRRRCGGPNPNSRRPLAFGYAAINSC